MAALQKCDVQNASSFTLLVGVEWNGVSNVPLV